MTSRGSRMALAPVLYRRAQRAADAAEPEQSYSGYDHEEEGYLRGLADAFLWLAEGTESEQIRELLAPPVAGEAS